MFNRFSLLATTTVLAIASFSPLISAQQTSQSFSLNVGDSVSNVKTEGFECAEESLSVLPLLGRGTEFPKFLLADVETELKRQAPTSELLKATCTAPPEVLAQVLEEQNGKPVEGQVLTKLRIEFYLDLSVYTGNEVVPLTIEHVYFVENLETTDQRKVTQKFIVIPQKD